MSINWVMLDEQKQTFIPLPKERILYTSPPRTSFSLTTPNTYPGKTPLSIQCSAGKAYVTTQRIIYLPSTPTPLPTSIPSPTNTLTSFTSPLLSLSDTHTTTPFFGPNGWTGIVRPVTGGGIPAAHAYVELKLVFKDGGAFDFHSAFERVRELAVDAVDSARESGRDVRDALGSLQGEELPAYEEPSAGTGIGGGSLAAVWGQTTSASASVSQGQQRGHLLDDDILPPNAPPPAMAANASQRREILTPPNEDPPGYEDVQRDGVANAFEERERNQVS